MSRDRRLRRFRTTIKILTIQELRIVIVNLNILYYQGLHHFLLNQNTPHPDKYLNYITSIDKKIEIAHNTIHTKLTEEEQIRHQQIRRVA